MASEDMKTCIGKWKYIYSNLHYTQKKYLIRHFFQVDKQWYLKPYCTNANLYIPVDWGADMIYSIASLGPLPVRFLCSLAKRVPAERKWVMLWKISSKINHQWWFKLVSETKLCGSVVPWYNRVVKQIISKTTFLHFNLKSWVYFERNVWQN